MLDLFVAFVAGFISFISPCVLPLVPAYIGYMGGRVANTVSAQVAVTDRVAVGSAGTVKSPAPAPLSVRFSTFLHGVAFVAGFTMLFVTFGVLIWQVSSLAAAEAMIARIGGMLIIAFGLHFMGIMPRIFAWLRQHDSMLDNVLTSLGVALVFSAMIAWGFTGTIALWDTGAYPLWEGIIAIIGIAGLWVWMLSHNAFVRPKPFWLETLNRLDYAFYTDTRRNMTAQGHQGFLGSAAMGVIFAAGWTPCIGPTLGVAITMAANGDDIPRAALLMTVYSLGLGIPFLLTALMLDSAQGALRRLKRYMAAIQMVSGLFLVVIGLLVASGDLQRLSTRMTTDFSDFATRLEECTVDLAKGELAFGDYMPCVRGTLKDVLPESAANDALLKWVALSVSHPSLTRTT